MIKLFLFFELYCLIVFKLSKKYLIGCIFDQFLGEFVCRERTSEIWRRVALFKRASNCSFDASCNLWLTNGTQHQSTRKNLFFSTKKKQQQQQSINQSNLENIDYESKSKFEPSMLDWPIACRQCPAPSRAPARRGRSRRRDWPSRRGRASRRARRPCR